MAPQAQPDLKKYLEKQVEVNMGGTRKVTGQLRGYDVFLNVVLDNAVEIKADGTKERMGMCVVRGNSISIIEALDRIGGPRPGQDQGYRGGPPMGGPPGQGRMGPPGM